MALDYSFFYTVTLYFFSHILFSLYLQFLFFLDHVRGRTFLRGGQMWQCPTALGLLTYT
jgi:hypothetical protein